MDTTILNIKPLLLDAGLAFGYLIGAFIALLLLVYLFYSLIKPENF